MERIIGLSGDGVGWGVASVAVADVDGLEGDGDEVTATDRLPLFVLTLEAGGVCLECLLHDGAAVGVVVGQEHGLSFELRLVYRVRASGKRQGGHCCRCHSGRRWQR